MIMSSCRRPGRPPLAALREFLSGATLYSSCIFLPMIIRSPRPTPTLQFSAPADLVILTLLSLSLALCRLLFVRILVPPTPQSKDLSRCQSSHLLSSSSYQFSKQHSAPLLPLPSYRLATVLFRLLFTSASCLSALHLFRHAIFWPHQLFGSHPHASTQSCWNLSGTVIALGSLDQDYDRTNPALKYFYLVQAAYQLHSLCFHAMGMAWFGTNLRSYVRPMVEHGVVLMLLAGSYPFSGLRRVGALGIFTLEWSGFFLQFLQMCVYAPEGSWWRRPGVVVGVHRFVTIPTFVYCRFYVLPFIVWYYAAFESQEWLEQIEQVFTKGWGEIIYYFFNGLLFLIFALNLVLFRRLLFHPHLRQIMEQGKNGLSGR